MSKQSSKNSGSAAAMPSQVSCLDCGRVFPSKIDGEIEPGGFMLCRGCGHVAVWTAELTLRELTEKERIDAGANFALMRERAKIVPKRSVQSPGSLAMTCLICLIIVMVALERFGIVPLLHQRNTSVGDPATSVEDHGHQKKPMLPWPK